MKRKRTLDGLETLPGAEAARRLRDEPDEVFFQLRQMIDDFGLTPVELKAELAAGRLVAVGVPDKGGYADICIRADHFNEWLKTSPRGWQCVADINAGRLPFQRPRGHA